MDLTPEIGDDLVEAYLRAVFSNWWIEMRRDELTDDVRAGLAAVLPRIRQSAYQAGREDAVRGEDQKRSNEKLRLALARDALVRTGYFTPEQVSDDIAPRIIELWSAISLGRSSQGVGDNPEEQRP